VPCRGVPRERDKPQNSIISLHVDNTEMAKAPKQEQKGESMAVQQRESVRSDAALRRARTGVPRTNELKPDSPRVGGVSGLVQVRVLES
jgi:hypothetical protein